MEIGTGTGSFARAAAPKCREVIAIDISAAMLRQAESNSRKAGLHNLTFKQDGFLSYKHEGEPLAAAVSQLALHHLPDAWKFVALHRLHRVMKPGGKLYLGDVVYDDGLGDAQHAGPCRLPH